MPESNEPVAVDRLVNLPVDSDTATDSIENGSHRWRSFLGSRWDVLLAISAGGALGSLARWGLGALVPGTGSTFPWATFIENISGGLALGVLMVFVLDVWPPRRHLRPFLGVGVLGGYTTFSTYMLETRHLFVEGQVVTAFTYLGGSLLVGLCAVWLGIASARLIAFGWPYRRRRPHPEQSTTAHPDHQERNP